MNKNGFIPLIIPIIAAVLLVAGGSLYLYNSKLSLTAPKNEDKKDKHSEIQIATESAKDQPHAPNPHSEATLSAKKSPKPIKTPDPTHKPKNSPIPTLSPLPTPKPTTTPTQTPIQTPTPQVSYTTSNNVVCIVHFNPSTGTAPAEINLINGASFTNSVNDYITNVQWDWDGDGNWDTDMSVNNQHLTHTYKNPGTYNVKMHLQTKNGYTSNVCSNTITIN